MRYLVVKGQAGLGNRMLCLATALLYARMTNRCLIVDWTDSGYSSDGSNTYPRVFQKPFTELATMPLSGSLYPPLWYGNLHRSVAEMIALYDPTQFSSPVIHRKYSPDLTRLEYAEDVLVMWCYTDQIRALRRHFTGKFAYLAKLSRECILRKLLRDELKLQPFIQERIDTIKRTRLEGQVVGVHIRFTDRKCPIGPTLRAVDRVRSCCPGAKLFLATDSKEAVCVMQERYGDVIMTEKWFPTIGASMHQNSECPDRFVNAVEALTDMYLLARCDYLVYPRSSTFSFLAALLSDAPADQIVDTERFRIDLRMRRALRAFMS